MGFEDRYYTDSHDTLYALPENPHILPIRDEETGHMRLKAALINTAAGRKETILLQPMGETILRQVTFR